MRANLFRVNAGPCMSGLTFGYKRFAPHASLPCTFMLKGHLGGKPRSFRSIHGRIRHSCHL